MMRAAIFTIDTGAYKAKAESAAATALKRLLEQVGFEVKAAGVLPQEKQVITAVISQLADSGSVELILTTGAVGYHERGLCGGSTGRRGGKTSSGNSGGSSHV